MIYESNYDKNYDVIDVFFVSFEPNKDEYRYDWTHEILDTEESKEFNVSRSRRISIITRVAPQNVESKIFDSFGTLEGKIIQFFP